MFIAYKPGTPHIPLYDPNSKASFSRELFLRILTLLPAVPFLLYDPTPLSRLLSLTTHAALYCSCSHWDLSRPSNILICSLKTELFSFLSFCQHLAQCLTHSRHSIHLYWMNVWITLRLGCLNFYHNLFPNHTQFEFKQFKINVSRCLQLLQQLN